jgi:DNA-binding Lrp family transcriptional regulator
MSAGCYVLLRFSDPDRLLPAAKFLQNNGLVAHWDAVEGHVQLVIKLYMNASAVTAQLHLLEGVQDVFAYDIVRDDETPQRDQALCHAYVFIEADQAKREEIRVAVKLFPEVLSCVLTEGGCDMAVLVGGSNFDLIDHFINGELYRIDGVLRLKYNRIIDLIG